MAKYPKRQKVKRYRRSFYSREMRVKKGIGIAVLVLVMLGAAWLAAPMCWTGQRIPGTPWCATGTFPPPPRQRERIVRGGEPGVLCGE